MEPPAGPNVEDAEGDIVDVPPGEKLDIGEGDCIPTPPPKEEPGIDEPKGEEGEAEFADDVDSDFFVPSLPKGLLKGLRQHTATTQLCKNE